MWADWAFNSTDGTTINPNVEGIMKFYDIFHYKELVDMLIFSFFLFAFKNLIAVQVDVVVMALIFLFTPSIRLCDKGEWVGWFQDYDLCIDGFKYDWQRGGLLMFGQTTSDGKILY